MCFEEKRVLFWIDVMKSKESFKAGRISKYVGILRMII